MVKKKVQDSLKIFQDMKNKEHEKVQKKWSQRRIQQVPKLNKEQYKKKRYMN
jgi:hypothetical protein